MLRSYRCQVNGVETVLRLSDKDAKARGLLPEWFSVIEPSQSILETGPKATPAKKARTPANKARGTRNKKA